VISPPSNYRDVQQELIADIQRTAIWPVVVNVDGKINIPEKSDFKDRDGSYIILIPHGNIDSLHAEISGLIVDRKKNSQSSGFPKFGLLLPEEMNSQRHNKQTYLIIYQNLEYLTALSLAETL